MVVDTTNVNGRITPAAEATISVFDRGFLYGDSVYEVFCTYGGGVPFLLNAHWERLENSARLIYMPITQTRQFLTAEIARTAVQAGARAGDEIYVRVCVTRGQGPVDLWPAPDLTTGYVIVVKKKFAWPARYYAEGVQLAIPPVRRNAPRALDPNVKSGNYLNNVLAVIEARQRGADDALLCNLEGELAECSNSNIFFVSNGAVLTPGVESGNLRGTTQEVVRQVGARHGLRVEGAVLRPDAIGAMSECFITSATREIMPVRSVRLESGEVVAFPEGGGELTRLLQQGYRDFVADFVAQHGDSALY